MSLGASKTPRVFFRPVAQRCDGYLHHQFTVHHSPWPFLAAIGIAVIDVDGNLAKTARRPAATAAVGEMLAYCPPSSAINVVRNRVGVEGGEGGGGRRNSICLRLLPTQTTGAGGATNHHASREKRDLQ